MKPQEKQLKVRDRMSIDPSTVGPNYSLQRVVELLRRRDIRAVPVIENDELVGIVTDRDLLGCLQQTHDPRLCKIATHMSRPVIVLNPDEDHIAAIDVMQRRRIMRLPLPRDGKVVGMVSLSDLAAVAKGEMHKVWGSWAAVAAIMRDQAVQVWVTKQRVKAGDESHGATPN